MAHKLHNAGIAEKLLPLYLIRRAASSVAYGCGLRVSEVAHLKVADIYSARMLIRVEQGKGRKEPYVMLAPDLLDLLRRWWKERRPQG